MGFLDGVSGFGSSASSAETNNTQQSAGFSEIGGSATSLNITGGKKAKTDTVVNILDGGAINKAFDFGAQALKQVELAGTSNAGAIRDAITAVSESARSESENVAISLGKWALIAAIAYFGFKALRG